MSEYFTGVTFARQNTSPVDDAIIRKTIISDGRLTGCEFSYVGSTLTMGPGQLIASGRQIRHPHEQSFVLNEASSGFARVLMTIDLSRTATRETFDQVNTSVEYAASQDGFLDLQQDDINAGGAIYQIVLATVSLGAGGITGIVYEATDVSPVGIAAAVIAVTYPEGSECTCSDGKRTLRARDKSGSFLFLIPYTGVWLVECRDGSKYAKSSVAVAQNDSKAVTLSFEIILFKTNTDATHELFQHNEANSRIDITDEKITVTCWALSGSNIWFHTKEKVDLTNFNTMTVKTNFTSIDGSNAWDGFGIVDDVSNLNVYVNAPWIAGTPINQTGAKTWTLDIANITGYHYPLLILAGTNGDIFEISVS